MKKIVWFGWLVLVMCSCAGKKEKPLFVWIDSTGEGRQVFVFFRNDVTLDKKPDKAEIKLFADSRYQLFVNGTMINFGPSRFYPQHPRYDTYNLLPYLREGKNTIAVKALSNGVHTYQTPKHTGGFIAWGEIKSGLRTISLSTPGNWLCIPVKGYNRDMPKVTFALHIQESYDARLDQPDWNLPSCDINNWQKPVVITKQDNWGTLEPRSIPHLTQDEMSMKKLLGVYPLKNDDYDLYTYRVKVPDDNDELYRTSFRLFAYTYIYSPRAQKADITGWWSEFWLNGDSVGYTQDETTLPKRIWHLNLKEGWNYLFIKYGSTEGIWDAFYKVPKKYGLIFSADKNKNTDISFYTAGPFTKEENEQVMKLPLPLSSPDKLPKLSASWKPQKRLHICQNPVWEIALSELGEKEEEYHASHSGKITVEKPSAILYDIGGKQLARFSADIEAPEGTILDVAFTEDTTGIRPWVFKRYMVNIGARFIAREGKNHFETFNPYGARFIHINIINIAGKPVTLENVKMISQVYPFIKKGSFECSDPMLTSLWEMGWRTLRVCSEDAYDDTPFRERGLYAGDCLPEFATTLATSGDPLLIKRCLELFHDMYSNLFTGKSSENTRSGRKRNALPDGLSDISDFPMITTLYFGWYLDRTNDWEFAAKLYPGYKKMIMDASENNTQPNGIIKTRNIFVEWSRIRRNNYCNTFANGLYARNCEILAGIANNLHYTNDARWFLEKSKNVISAIHKNCWDDEKGAFCDGIDTTGPVKNFYPISSAVMSLFGYTSHAQEKKLTVFYENSLKERSSKVRDGLATSYGGFYLLGAFYRSGYAGIAEHFIRRYWSPMLLYLDDTMWEDFAENSELLRSSTLSHAWSSAPTYYLTTQVLGVQLGFPYKSNPDTIRIEPQAETIYWAKGNVPHPEGMIHVDWSIKGNNLFLNYTAPEGPEIIVNPKGKLAQYTLWINGVKK